MSKLYIVNCVKYNGVVYDKGQEIDLSKDPKTAKSLLEGKAVTKVNPNADKEEEAPKAPIVPDVFVNPFTEIGIEDKHAEVLIKKGFNNMEELGKAEEKTLADIHGISKTLAKEIVECLKD